MALVFVAPRAMAPLLLFRSLSRRHGAGGRWFSVANHVNSHLTLDVIRQPHPDAVRDAHRALDDLAEGLADRLIARARRQVAHERRVSEDALDHAREHVAEATRAVASLQMEIT